MKSKKALAALMAGTMVLGCTTGVAAADAEYVINL